jgi:GxxExxY protein
MFHTESAKARANELSRVIIGAAIEVHRELGPGLLESAYEKCLKYELEQAGLRVQHQLELPVVYKGLNLDCAYRIDLLVEEHVVIEMKAVDKLLPIHDSQTLTYLRLSKRWLGLLMNFHVPVLKNGMKRLIWDPVPNPELPVL